MAFEGELDFLLAVALDLRLTGHQTHLPMCGSDFPFAPRWETENPSCALCHKGTLHSNKFACNCCPSLEVVLLMPAHGEIDGP